MNYTFLRRGDQLPAVGVLQKLLNRGEAKLVADGIFGPHTEAAVREFQRVRHMGVDGIVGKDTWPRVSAGANLRILDCIDVFDPSLLQLEATDIKRAGGNPMLIGGACNGVAEAVNLILRAAGAGTVFLLRFHGHGAPGVAGVSFGQGEIGWGERADIDVANFNTLQPTLARLRPIFSDYGNVQFMHCETGSGTKGRRLLQLIANTLGVPATAALHIQYGGGLDTFKFEGPTFTALPGGGSLGTWCRSLPDFPGMSVA
jgi:hypothetical protein